MQAVRAQSASAFHAAIRKEAHVASMRSTDLTAIRSRGGVHAGSQIVRCIRFTTPLSGKMGPRQAVCYERFTLVSRTAGGFHVSMEATTPEVCLLTDVSSHILRDHITSKHIPFAFKHSTCGSCTAGAFHVSMEATTPEVHLVTEVPFDMAHHHVM